MFLLETVLVFVDAECGARVQGRFPRGLHVKATKMLGEKNTIYGSVFVARNVRTLCNSTACVNMPPPAPTEQHNVFDRMRQ